MILSETPYKSFRTLYSSLVRKADNIEDELFQDQMTLMLDIMSNDLSKEDIRKIFTEKIIQDRKNSELYVNPRDRSAINREIYITTARLRSYIMMIFFTIIAVMLCAMGVLILIDYWTEISIAGNSPYQSYSIRDIIIKRIIGGE